MIVRALSNDTGDPSKSGGAGTWSPPSFVAQPDWRDGQGDQLVGLYGSDDGGIDGGGGVGIDGGGSKSGGGGEDSGSDGSSSDSNDSGSGSGMGRFAACSFNGDRIIVGVIGMFHALSQTIDNQFALSSDGGLSWWRPGRRPNVPLQPLGEWGSGLIWPFRSLVADAADTTGSTVHMYFSGTEGLHGDMFSTLPAEVLAQGQQAMGPGPGGAGGGTWNYGPIRSYPGLVGGEGGKNYQAMSFSRTSIWFSGALMRSSWSRGRLFALVPASGGIHPGVAVTKPLAVADISRGGGGRGGADGSAPVIQLRVNAVTVRAGRVSAELVDWTHADASTACATAPPLPGFSLADCTAFEGDQEHGVVSWKGGALPAGVTAVRVRLVVLRARVYGMHLEQ
jgi:hypothetical protein